MATKVVLSVMDRIHFPSILPQAGSIVEMELSENLSKRISFAPEEIKEVEMANLPDGRIVWNAAKAKLREFRFENFEITLIQEGIRILDEKKQIQPSNLNLAKRFKGINIKTKE